MVTLLMPYSCFIIGEDTLLIECATILRQHGFQIKGIISNDTQVSRYCTEAGLNYIDSRLPFADILEETSFDYLFSITNKYILPESLLRLPRKHTINYHDGPLPAYAGVHATFWALVNQEKTHGITWHIADAGIDTGPILKQSRFAIEPDETSIRLNIKCYSAAVTAFGELIDALKSDTLVSQPQDASQRSYFGRNKRPDTFINWQKPAAETVRLYRALGFGFHPNPFGYLKIRLGQEFLLVKELSESAEATEQSPGTITAIETDELWVATNDGLLVIRALATLDGEPVAISEISRQWNLKSGQVLTQHEADFRQRYFQTDAQCVRHQSYWLEKLSNLSLTTIPFANPQNVTKSQKPGIEFVDVQLNPTVATAFESLPLTSDKTDWLLTSFLITVARLSNQLSIGIGYSSPASQQLAANTAGLFTDCLPFTIDFDWESGFEKAVSAIRHEQKAVEDNLSFARDWLVAQAALQPLVQELGEHGFPIVIHRMTDKADFPTPKNALTLIVIDEAACQIACDTAVWDANQVSELINRWLITLENLVSQPEQPLKAVSLLTPDERHRMLVDWNATDVPYPRDQTVFELVEAQAQLQPQAEAIRCGAVTQTYEQLNQRANQLARYLQKQGIKPGTLVGLCTERSPEMIICLLAILKTGAAYMPLDPVYPAARLEELQKQTDIRFILTQRKWLDRLPAKGATYIILDRKPWADESTENLNLPASADQLAYVLFTSGSTGRSKSVAIPHRGIVRLVKGANYMRLNDTVRMLGLAPLAFDASTLEIWGSLANGGQLVLITDSPPTLDAIKQTIQTNQVNTVFFTAALFNVLVDSGIEELTTLTQLLTGGEAASVEHLSRAQRQLPACTLINGYGPTESTTFASFYTLPSDDLQTNSVPIGRPISNTQIYLVDSFDNPVPVGIPGELLIGGDGLAREYLFQPELTTEKFIADPFNAQPGRRLYRTGDQARYWNDGTIEFLGRLDDQIKIRGFRIEPGEIEHALCQHPTVAEAVVVAAESTPGHKVLAAYLVPKSNTVLIPEELRAFLQTQLPDHLIPAAFISLKAMPLTGNGKLDKSRLPPAFLRSQKSGGEVLTQTEAVLMRLWTGVLNNPHSSSEDNFFELGGSSLLAMQLLARIHQQFDRLLSMKDVFEHPTIRQLSAYLDQNPQPGSTRIADPKPANSPDSESGIPLSFAQNRLWIIHQLHELHGTYNVPIVLKISGPLNVPVLQQSLAEIVRRHQILRTTFSHTDGFPFQRIAPADSVPVSINEVKSLKTGSLNTWLNAEAYQPFDLEEGPLFRVSLLHLGPDSRLLLLVFHHIIYDGWSTRVLANELSLLYTAFVQQQPVSLPQLPLQYADYARWQIENYTPQTLQRELAYWKNRLAGAPFLLNLPIDKPRPRIQSFDGIDYSFPIPPELWDQIRFGLQEPGTTVFLRLLTVFSVWLSRITHTHDIIIGTPVAGRSRSELAHTIGFFVNTIPLRIEISEDSSFRHLLRLVRQWALAAYDHQELPFEQIVEALKLPRNLAYTPLVQVMFDFQEDNSKDWKLDGLHAESIPFEQHTAKFDLHLSIRETAEGPEGVFTYRSDLFENQTVARIAHGFVAVLKELVAEPDKPLKERTGQGVNRKEIPPVTPSVTNVTNEQLKPETDRLAGDEPLINLLRTTWCWLLEVPEIGLDDDFFDTGGHSLLAFQLTTELQQTGYTIPVGDVFANPTIRKLVAHLKTTQPDLVWQSLVAVKPQGNHSPLYLVHPITGDIGYVYQLAPYLPANRPVYGLRAVGLDRIAKPLPSIEAMAAHYVQLILEQQPTGPYALGGYSMGGIIVFEMAHQLKQLGKEVSLVALIDCYPVNPDASNPNQIPMGQLLTYYYNVWRSMPKRPRLLWQAFREKIPMVSSYFLNRIRHSLQNPTQKAVIQQTETGLAAPDNLLVTTSQQAYSDYSFRPYDGRVVLLRATGKDGFADSHRKVTFGWDRYARQGVDVHLIPADHYSLFKDEEIISRIGAVLTSYLALDSHSRRQDAPDPIHEMTKK